MSQNDIIRRASTGLTPSTSAAQQRLEGDAPVGLQHQRQQEVHVELAVAVPRLARPEPLERADVDEPGRAPTNWTL